MTNPSLPDEDHVSRYCKPSTVEYGMPMSAAFMPRPSEEYLSVNWLEHFGEPTLASAIGKVRAVFSEKGYRLARNGRFAALNVGAVKRAVPKHIGVTLSINHIPFDDDQSHAGIIGYTSNDLVVAVELVALLTQQDIHPAVA